MERPDPRRQRMIALAQMLVKAAEGSPRLVKGAAELERAVAKANAAWVQYDRAAAHFGAAERQRAALWVAFREEWRRRGD